MAKDEIILIELFYKIKSPPNYREAFSFHLTQPKTILIKELGTGIIGKSRIEKGFVITHVNEEPVNTVEEFYEALKKASSSSVKISGVYPGYFGNYAFILNLNE